MRPSAAPRWRVKKAPALYNAWKVLSPEGDAHYEDTFADALRFADAAARARWIVMPRVQTLGGQPFLRMGKWGQVELQGPARPGDAARLLEFEGDFVLKEVRFDPTWLFDIGVAMISMHHYLERCGGPVALPEPGVLGDTYEEVSFDD